MEIALKKILGYHKCLSVQFNTVQLYFNHIFKDKRGFYEIMYKDVLKFFLNGAKKYS